MRIDDPVSFLRGEKIEAALNKEYRQYLAGRLAREQKHLPHIDDEIEVGISFYESFTADQPHVHPIATEHGYVLQGIVRLKELDGAKKEYEFGTGDFFVVRKGMPYASKHAAGTKVLFIKTPGLNDKALVEADESLEAWLSCWDS